MHLRMVSLSMGCVTVLGILTDQASRPLLTVAAQLRCASPGGSYRAATGTSIGDGAIMGPKMASEASSARRLLLVLFVLCATVCAQSASLVAEQETHHDPGHCCRLCHAGPAPILPVNTSPIIAPIFSPVLFAVSRPVSAPHEALVTAAASRAPPA